MGSVAEQPDNELINNKFMRLQTLLVDDDGRRIDGIALIERPVTNVDPHFHIGSLTSKKVNRFHVIIQSAFNWSVVVVVG